MPIAPTGFLFDHACGSQYYGFSRREFAMKNPAELTLGGWMVYVLREADGALSMEEALHSILDSMKVYFPAQSVAVILFDDDTNEAHIKISRQISYSYVKEFHHKTPGPQIERLMLSQEPLLLHERPGRDEEYAELKMEHDFTSAVLAPVITNHRSIGYIFCDRNGPPSFTESDLLHLQVVGFLIGSLMVKFELLQERRQLSQTDDATNALKYAVFVAALDTELKRSVSHAYAVTLALIQLPTFKNFLDMHGIDRAHAALAELVRIIGRHTRTTDLLARYSADRLILCLSGLTEAEALQMLTAIRDEARSEVGAGSGIEVEALIGAIFLESEIQKKQPLQTLIGSLGKSLVEASKSGLSLKR
jgi:diguanylate cyclase (GGDEF)-like protein